VRSYLRQVSNDIHELKERAKVVREGVVVDHIKPGHKWWKRYSGLKREAMRWLAAVHVLKAGKVGIVCIKSMSKAFPKHDIHRLCNEAVRKIGRIHDGLEKRRGREQRRLVSEEVVGA
jgi:hypothetical protein